MGRITAGEVEYGRMVKTGDYENKKATVKLYFSVEDGEDHTASLEAAAKEAHAKTHAMLGIKSAAEVHPKVEVLTSPATVSPATKEAAAKAMNAKDKAEAKAAAEPKAPKAAKPKPEPKPEPAQAPDAFDETSPETLPDVSDTDLTTALNKQIATLKPVHGDAAGKKLRELIATFVEPPKKSHDIPQNVRHEFLKKLAALT